MRKRKVFAFLHAVGMWALVFVGLAMPALAADVTGKVQAANGPIAGATVTLFAAGTGTPTQLSQAKTGDDGAFTLDAGKAPADAVLYVIAKGGTPQASAAKTANDAIALIAVLGSAPPKSITVNE